MLQAYSGSVWSRRLRFAEARLFVALWVLIIAAPAWGLDPGVPLAQLRHTVWQAKDGAPADSINYAFDQTADGYLWIATNSGLVRFDGQRFERVAMPKHPGLKSTSVYSLFAPRTGGLWIGFTFGGIGFWKDGSLEFYGREDGVPPGTVQDIKQGPDEAIWIVASSGMARFKGGRWQRVELSPEGADGPINELFFDSGGNVWAIGRRAVYRRAQNETVFQRYRDMTNESTLVQSPSGVVWLIEGNTAQRIDQQPSVRAGELQAKGSGVADGTGSLWALVGSDIVRVRSPDPEHVIDLAISVDRLALQQGSERNRVRRFLISRDGLVWLFGSDGLQRFSERMVREVDISSLPSSTAQNLGIGAAADSSIYAVPLAGALAQLQSNRFATVAGPTDVSALGKTADGTVWAGGEGKLWQRKADGTFVGRPMPPETGSRPIQGIVGRGPDDFWISIRLNGGVFHWAQGGWHRNGGLAGLPAEPAVSMCLDASGSIWLGYVGNRIARVNGSSVQLFRESEGVDVGVVTALHSRGSHVWAGGESGLRIWDGRSFHTVRGNSEHALEFITGIIETAKGDVWLNSANGIVHIGAADAARASVGIGSPAALDVFDRLDGFTGSGGRVAPLPTAVEGADGRLWFASSTGIFSIEAQAVIRQRDPPQPLIEGLVANGVSHDTYSPIELAKGTSSLRIDYVGLDLAQPERVKYKYRLDRVDTDWREVGSRRQAFYTNLDPGKYRFQVIATSDDRTWTSNSTELAFTILPTFTQTSAFFVMCLLAALGLIVLLFRWRLRAMAQRLRWKLEAQLDERDRIARELHDTLLQSTQGLILRFQAVADRMQETDPSRHMLESALERADDVLTEGREQVRGLRGAKDVDDAWPAVLESFGTELSADTGVAFRFEMRGSEPVLSSEAAQEVQRIASEALFNAFRHAHARTIDLLLLNDGDTLRVCVDDDGVGIDRTLSAKGSRPGHWGLPGMRERSARLGARLEIGARSGGGTQVELTLPLNRSGRIE